MKAIIIAAGRGSRLGALTDDQPKTLTSVLGRPMFDWILAAYRRAGFSDDRIVVVSGYRDDVLRARYPSLTYVQNTGWESNNILLSLLCAREHMDEGFVSSYADIVYHERAVQLVMEAPADAALLCDSRWRERYAGRTQHPESDGEKVRIEGNLIVELARTLAPESAPAEFTGVMKLTPNGVRGFLSAFDLAQARYAGKVFRGGRTFEKAYLLDLLEEWRQAGQPLRAVLTPGGYMEIDTQQDLGLAEQWRRDLWPAQ